MGSITKESKELTFSLNLLLASACVFMLICTICCIGCIGGYRYGLSRRVFWFDPYANGSNKIGLISMLCNPFKNEGIEVKQALKDADTLIINTVCQRNFDQR